MTDARSRLLDPEWRYIEKPALDQFTLGDWTLLGTQRRVYYAQEQGAQVLRLLAASRDDAGFGYEVNNYRHCIQAATAALKDGRDEDYVVMALLHDIGFIACPDSHGAFSAALMAPYLPDELVWILERHQWFLDAHCESHPAVDGAVRERWRGHPWFAAAAEFVARYDQSTISPRGGELPLDVFAPMVQRVFAKPRRTILPPV